MKLLLLLLNILTKISQSVSKIRYREYQSFQLRYLSLFNNIQPINTLLLSRPQWREHDESKWVGGKEFQSMNSRKDHGWEPIKNVIQEYREPFIENKVKFRDISSNNHTTIIPLSSSYSKRRNNSQIRTQVPSVKGSMFRNSPSRSSGREDARSGNSGSNPAPEPQLFDSTIPADKTWKNRIIQSNSLR